MRTLALSSLAAVAVLATLAPAEADACGGFFCDTGPSSMPVDQTGENILFVMGGSFTEAHIQIQYDPTTTAAKFAWIVPMTAVPDFSVGSEAFFQNVLGSTQPNYGYNTMQDDCDWGEADDGGFDTNASGISSAGGDGSGGLDEGGETGAGPDILLQETVGAYDIVVLSGGTAAEVVDWLNMNGYAQDPEAEPILADYLAENYMFAAFKLTNGAEVAEVHPVVLRFEQDEACVPIRLTRIAAQDDMEIRTFFLADSRVVPQTYRHVLVNPLMLDWPNFAANYKEIITLAVDAFGADGKAFVTEYAGPSGIVFPDGIANPSWDPQAFVGLDPVSVIDVLQSQGVPSSQPMLLGLLSQYLPVPVGLTAQEFYNCLSCYQDQIDVAAWGDGSGFAMAMQDLIVGPGQHAVDLLGQFPYLTRMYTTISPAEMTADPFFWQNHDLPDVDLVNQQATRRIMCSSDELWTLPDGRQVFVPAGMGWPEFPDEMPYEEEVSETPEFGAQVMLVDNSQAIDAVLAETNCDNGWCGGDPATAGNGGDGNGCACTGGDSGPLGALAMTFGIGLGLVARRRNRHE